MYVNNICTTLKKSIGLIKTIDFDTEITQNSILLAESHEGHLTEYIVPEGPESMI